MASPPVTLEISKRKNLSISNARGPDGLSSTWLMRSTKEKRDIRMPLDDETGFYEPEETWKGTNFDQRWRAARTSTEIHSENGSRAESEEESDVLAIVAHRMDQPVPELGSSPHSNKIPNGMNSPSLAEAPTKEEASPRTSENAREKTSREAESAEEQQPSAETSLVVQEMPHETTSLPVEKLNKTSGTAKTGPVLKPITDSSLPRYSWTHSRKPSSMSSSVSPVPTHSSGASPPKPSSGGELKPEKQRRSGFRRLISLGTSGSDSIRNAFSKSRKSSGSFTDITASHQRSVSQPGPRPLPPSPPKLYSNDLTSVSKTGSSKSVPDIKPLPTSAPVLPNLDLDLDLTSDLDPKIQDAFDTSGSQTSTFHDIVDAYLKEKAELEGEESDADTGSTLHLSKTRAKSSSSHASSGQSRKISSASIRHVTGDEPDPEDIKLQEKLVKLQEEIDQFKQKISGREKKLAKLKSSLVPEELYKYSKEEREILKQQHTNLEEELAVLRKKQYEVGIMYSKAWKRRRENGSSDFWVRSH